MKTVTIKLDGAEYVIREKRHRDNRAWRAALEQPIKELLDTVSGAQDTEITDVPSLIAVFDTVSSTLLSSTDIVCELLISYDPALRDVVEDGYDSEILDAFREVLKLAYPFGNLIQTVKKLGAQVQ
jgi:hypothetical protein